MAPVSGRPVEVTWAFGQNIFKIYLHFCLYLDRFLCFEMQSVTLLRGPSRAGDKGRVQSIANLGIPRGSAELAALAWGLGCCLAFWLEGVPAAEFPMKFNFTTHKSVPNPSPMDVVRWQRLSDEAASVLVPLVCDGSRLKVGTSSECSREVVRSRSEAGWFFTTYEMSPTNPPLLSGSLIALAALQSTDVQQRL